MKTLFKKDEGSLQYNIDPITGIMKTKFTNPLPNKSPGSKKRRSR